jgi:class 3 adenylate cyclase
MDFFTVVDQVIELLRSRGRVSYRASKRQFALDDAYLADLKAELIEVQQLAVDQDGTMLVWMGEHGTASPLAPQPTREPLAYTPPYLAEKILTSKTALEGERKQVTVLFADLKGSTALSAGLDPEKARHLLDPVLERMIETVHRYEGTVNQVLGDGIMALFDAPIAHTDHAVCASLWRRVPGLLRPGRSGRRHQQPAGQPCGRGAGGGRAVALARMSGQKEDL